jgi:hypothetical protein
MHAAASSLAEDKTQDTKDKTQREAAKKVERWAVQGDYE